MTYKRPGYEQVTIAHGANTVTLRPSLRAACTLEDRYGFPALYKAMDELNFTIISEIILSACPDRRDAVAFLGGNLERPLSSFFRAMQQPIAELLTMFVPAPDEKAKRTVGTAKPLTWPEIYAALFDRATGWLGWTPDTAWNATPTEIDRAYWAHVQQLKAIHGSSDDKPNDRQISPEQAAHNEAAGLDPEFDRAGLLALKAKIAGAS